MKKNIISVMMVMTMAFASCDDFLTSNPHDFLDPESYYTDLDKFNAGLTGIYSLLASQGSGTGAGYTVYGEENLIQMFVTSDLDYFRVANPNVRAMSAIFNFTSSDAHVNEYWRACYNGVARANSFIQQTEESQIYGVDEKYRDAAVGEAYFMRGFYYWHLAANWGGVPLNLKFDPENINPHQARAPLNDVYEQILSDMKKAESMVYDVTKFNHNGRVTHTTVLAMLARVCLYMASEHLGVGDADKYAEAAEWARKVKNSNLHRLNPSYENLFTRMICEEYDLDYRESMWEAEFKGMPPLTPRTVGKWGGVNGILCNDSEIGFAWAQTFVSRLFENMYINDGNAEDSRYDWNVPKYDWGTATSNATKRNRSVEQRSPGKYRREVFTGFKEDNYTDTNFPIMRYADVLLMLAEAVNEVDGPTDEAIDALNEVRIRAGSGMKLCTNKANADTDVYYLLLTKEDFREFLKNERARELCFEATRRLDLIRWGHLLKSMKDMGEVANQATAKRSANYASEKHNLLPIPVSEMNTNRLMEQNPGW